MSVQYNLDSPPADIISAIHFNPDTARVLAVASWDGKISFYGRNATSTSNEAPYSPIGITEVGYPILDFCFTPYGIVVVGLAQVVGLLANPSTDKGDQEPEKVLLSVHGAASNKVAYSKEQNLVISTSWDATMHVHAVDTMKYIAVKLPEKAFALSLSAEKVVVAMAERKVNVYELATLKTLLQERGVEAKSANDTDPSTREILDIETWQQRESSLKFMTRAVACLPNGEGFVASSIEGRVGVEFFDPAQQKKNYAFKCHRQTSKIQDEDGEEQDVDVVYPVNALAFHPVHGTFATGGGDGGVALWDAETKRRVKQYTRMDSSVLAMDFSDDGEMLAIGLSAGLEDGKETSDQVDAASIHVVIRTMPGNEAKGLPWSIPNLEDAERTTNGQNSELVVEYAALGTASTGAVVSSSP
nr:mitotic checkpoint protein bub3.1 [Quercus suber]